jgi:hypothetical protein
MSKEQISIQIPPEILKEIDKMAAAETKTRNNMLEVLILEAFQARLLANSAQLFEQLDRLADPNLTGEGLDKEIRRSHALVKTKRRNP